MEPEIVIKNIRENGKTKKNKMKMTALEKQQLWGIFEKDKQVIKPKSEDGTSVECVYDQHSQPEKSDSDGKTIETCYLCGSHLVIMENGFPTCTNPSCSIIYTNTLDYSPEWRFYGADDKNANDPTRCV